METLQQHQTCLTMPMYGCMSIQAPIVRNQKYGFTQVKDRLPSVTENLELHLRQCATLSGKRMS